MTLKATFIAALLTLSLTQTAVFAEQASKDEFANAPVVTVVDPGLRVVTVVDAGQTTKAEKLTKTNKRLAESPKATVTSAKQKS